jgi:hypothetical protein|tara:strand:+ start:124 stop:591 length:468 start_codon:yes stop_codon:yes gene_type:complete
MSNFWDGVFEPVVEAIIEPVSTSGFWSSIGLGVNVKPVEQSKPKIVKGKKSKAVAQAEIVYETVEGLVVPATDCTHYWVIPSENAWAIGICNNCSGEMWFSNRWSEQSTFNDTLVPPPSIQKEITDSMDMDADVRDILTESIKEITTYREIEDGA